MTSDGVCEFLPSKMNRIKELTEKLVKDECELGSFFDLSPDLLCIISPSGYFLKLNRAWERELGWTVQELAERPIYDFIHQEDIKGTKGIIENAGSNKVLRFYNRYKIKGSDKYITLEWKAISQPNGYMYAIAREVPCECGNCSAARLKWDCSGSDNGPR